MARRQGRPAPLKVFGSEVRRFRELTGLSQAQLGDKIPISSSHIGKIERGETRCDRKLAVSMDEILDTRGSLPSLWDELVEKAVFPAWFDWPEIEAEAIRLQSYECMVVYGLLQTERYAAALLESDPHAVSARMGRQEILHRQDSPPPALSALLAESTLTNEVGGSDVMREQLEHLLSAPTSRISIQVIRSPLPPAGIAGAFCMATLPDRSELAYVETAARGLTLNEPSDIQTISDRYDTLRSRALPVDLSRDHIQMIMEERWT
jgi:transcriptional regulator with XRE-family HTH domain